MFRRIVPIAACAVAVLGALAIRVVVEGRAALRAGDEAAAKGATIAAIDHYETAARWYVPLAPHVDDAYSKLRVLAASTDPAISLAAWRAIRSAARATRSLWTPHADDLAAADAAIARLSARDPNAGALAEEDKPASPAAGSGAGAGSGGDATTAGSGGDATTAGPGSATTTGSGGDATTASPRGSGSALTPDELAAREAWHRRRLAIDVRPSVGAAALAGLGILLWLGGVWTLVRRGVDRTGAWIPRPAAVSGAAIVVGLVLWFVGLYNA